MTTRNNSKLTLNQKIFADTYLSDPERNATKAYKSVFPKCKQKSAESGAARMLGIAKVSEYISERTDELFSQFSIDQERIIQELSFAAFFDPRALFGDDGQLLPLADIREESRRAISSFDITSKGSKSKTNDAEVTVSKLRLVDKIRALELLGKHLNMWTDKVERSEPAEGTLSDLLNQLGGQGVIPPNLSNSD